MAYLVSSTEAATFQIKTNPLLRRPVTKSPYEVPERFRDAFYLANAAFYDNVNWFLHRTYELYFDALRRDKFGGSGDREAFEEIIGTIDALDQCDSVVDVRFAVRRDDEGRVKVRGFRAQHGLAIGYKACLGGLSIDPNITRDYMKALSVLSTYKNACMGIALSGAHGGIKICPMDHSQGELQRILEEYSIKIGQREFCSNSDRTVLYPDIGSSPREMSWIYQTRKAIGECESKVGVNSLGESACMAVTGKLETHGGFEDYPLAAPLGAFMALDYFLHNEEVMEKIGLNPGMKEKTFIIQGLGKLGCQLAEYLIANGAVCVGVKDIDAYLYEPKGIDLSSLLEHKTRTGSIINYGLAKPETNAKIFEMECDVLILAACPKSLMCYTADNVKAKVILEAADGPITPGAHRILIGKNKLVLPDIYAYAGGTVASYLEYLKGMKELDQVDEELLRASNPVYKNALDGMLSQTRYVERLGRTETSSPSLKNIIQDTLSIILTEVGKELTQLALTHDLGTDIRSAAYMIAINNIFTAFRRKVQT